MFGRATIRLGIGQHSSCYICLSRNIEVAVCGIILQLLKKVSSDPVT